MPAMSAAPGVVYVGLGDTFPIPFTIVDNAGDPIALTNANDVQINIAYARWDPYFSPTAYIVQDRPCTIVRPQTGGDIGRVIYNPLTPDFVAAGSFNYQFRIYWNDGTIQTTPPYFYPKMQVLAPVAGLPTNVTGAP